MPLILLTLAKMSPPNLAIYNEQPPPPTRPNEGAYYQVPPFEVMDQDGNALRSEPLKGSFYLATFFFTRCTTICPPNMARVAAFQRRMKAEGWKIPLLSFTVDPIHDAPPILKSYGDRLGVDWQGWHFATSNDKDYLTLLRDGFKVPVGNPPPMEMDGLGEMDIAHSGVALLVNPEGFVSGVLDLNAPDWDLGFPIG